MGLFGGIGDAVSGFFGGGQKDPQLRTVPSSMMSGEQNEVARRLRNLINPGLEDGATPYSGTRVPGQNQLLSNYFSGAGNINTGSLYSGAGDALQQAMSGQPLYGADMDAARNYWESAYYQPAMEKYMNDALPKLRESYAGGTFNSGGRLRAEQDALADVMTGLNSNLASIMYGEHQAGQNERDLAANRALVGTAQAQQFGQLPGQAGASLYGYEQAPLEEDYQNWLIQQGWANPYLSSALSMISAGGGGQSPYLYQQQPSTASNIGSTLGQLAGLGAGNWLGSLF